MVGNWLRVLAALTQLGLAAFARGETSPVDSAFAAAESSGRPILAIAGRESCGACKALEQRLNSDRALAPLVAQFVPLVLDVDKPDFQAWSARAPFSGNFIPYVYIVRADGKVLHAASGAPQGEELPLLLATQLQQAGVALPEEKLTQLANAWAAAVKFRQAGQTSPAIQKILRFAGSGSFAKPAVELDKLLSDIQAEAQASVAAAQKRLAEEDPPVEAAMDLLHAAQTYARLPQFKNALKATILKYRKQVETKDLFAQADLLNRGKQSEEKGSVKRANDAYGQVISRFPDAPAARLAQDRMDAIAAEMDAKKAPSQP